MACARCSRRDFLAFSGKAVVAGVAVQALPSCTTAQKTVAAGNATLTVDISLPENVALADAGGAVYVNDPNDIERPIIVVRAADDLVFAFSSRCTHAGGFVGLPAGGLETCPLHGSKFDIAGKVLLGPATVNLTSYTAVLSGNVITITV
jgi:Rieske Fe-S protein